MKPQLIMLLLLLWGPLDAVPEEESSTRRAWIYYSTDQPYKVNIQSDRGLVLVLDIPQGVFLCVEFDYPKMPTEDEHTFRGDVVIQTRREDEMSETESKFMSDIMAKAPVEILLTNVVVVVEPL